MKKEIYISVEEAENGEYCVYFPSSDESARGDLMEGNDYTFDKDKKGVLGDLVKLGLFTKEIVEHENFWEEIQEGMTLERVVELWEEEFDEMDEVDKVNAFIGLVGVPLTDKNWAGLELNPVKGETHGFESELHYALYNLLTGLYSSSYFSFKKTWYEGGAGTVYDAFKEFCEEFGYDDSDEYTAKQAMGIFEWEGKRYENMFSDGDGGQNPFIPDELWNLIDNIS